MRSARWYAGRAVLAPLAIALAMALAGCSSQDSGTAAAAPTAMASTGEPGATSEASTARGPDEDPGATAPAEDASTSSSSGSPSADAVARSAPPPVGTDISDEVEVVEQEVLAGVAWDQPVTVDGQVTVSITSADRVQAEARTTGEIAGSAAALAISIHNESPDALDLTQVTVTGTSADGAPLSALSSEPATPFEGDLATGATAEAVYLFSLAGAVTPVIITVNHAPEAPVAVFEGALSE